jgi:hypothetical protein
MHDPIWDATMFTQNRRHLPAGDVACAFLEHVVAEARGQHLLSSKHFSVAATLIGARESIKTFLSTAAAAGPPRRSRVFALVPLIASV